MLKKTLIATATAGMVATAARAASQGNLANGDPERWAIHEGKLYLNYSKGVQKKWLKDKPGFIAKADANWPGLLDK